MHEIEKLENQLGKKQADLTKVTEDKASASSKREDLRREMFGAIRKKVAGDESQIKLIANLDLKIRSLETEIEVYDRPKGLIDEAKAEVGKARAALKEAESQKEARWQVFKTQETEKDTVDRIADLPGLLQKANESYIELQVALGECCKIWALCESRRSSQITPAGEFIGKIPERLGEHFRKVGLQFIDLPGIPPMVVQAGLIPSVGFKGASVNSIRAHAQDHEMRRFDDLRKKFEHNENGR